MFQERLDKLVAEERGAMAKLRNLEQRYWLR